MAKRTSKEIELPEYLGLGNLDKNSITRHGNSLSADYLDGNDLVFRVSRVSGTVLIEEYLDGIQTVVTMHKDLKNAFIHHMMSFTPYQNRRFERVYHRICDGRNIFLRYPERPEIIYFPAGYLFSLRLPVTSVNRNEWGRLMRDLNYHGEQTSIKVTGQRTATVFRLLKSGDVTEEKLLVADCSATLIQLSSAAKLLWERGVILSKKEYRLSITDISEVVPDNIEVFLGDPDCGYLTYSVVITEDLNIPTSEVKNQFLNMSKEFLKDL